MDRERPHGAGAGVCKHTCVRTRTRPSDWGVAPATARAARVPRPTERPGRKTLLHLRMAGNPRAHGRSVEVRIGPPRRLRTPVRSQVARRPSVSVLRRGARPAARRSRRIDRLPPVHGAAKDAAKAADGWRPPCESPEGRSVNRPLASFSHSSTAVSGSAGASANALRLARLPSGGSGFGRGCLLSLRRPPRPSFAGTGSSSRRCGQPR